jgi:octaprenyl-diphosphate synthase
VQPDFLKDVIRDDMIEVNRVLRENLSSQIALINQIADHIIGSGGKRLRPALLVLSARACGYTGTMHYLLAAIVEMIHTSTLLHDDVVDDSSQRRGKPTANHAFGNAAPVLAGDFLYSRSFQLMVGTRSLKILQILSDATNVIAEGEVQQLMSAGNPDLDEDGYFQVIRRKTAVLFEAAARLGAVLSDESDETEQAFALYGRHLGMAFQIMDDVLDYTGDAALIGKNLGDDLAEGKMTLPLIYAMRAGNAEDAALIRRVILSRKTGEHFDTGKVLPTLIDMLTRVLALETTQTRAREESQKASEALTSALKLSNGCSLSRQTLLKLATFAVERSF